MAARPDASLLRRVNAMGAERGAAPPRDPFATLPDVSTVDPMLSMRRPQYDHVHKDVWGSGSKIVLTKFRPPERATPAAESPVLPDPRRHRRRAGDHVASDGAGDEDHEADGSLDPRHVDAYRTDIADDASNEDRRATLRRADEDALMRKFLELRKARDRLAHRDREERAELYRTTRDAVKWRAVFQLHCHLTTLSDPNFDPSEGPLLDEPDRKKRAATKRRLERQARQRRRMRRRRAQAMQAALLRHSSHAAALAEIVRREAAGELGEDGAGGDDDSDLEAELGDDEHALAILRAAREPLGAMDGPAARALILPGPGSEAAALSPGAYLRPLFSALYRQNPGTEISKARFVTTVRGLMADMVMRAVRRRQELERTANARHLAAVDRVRAQAEARRVARMMPSLATQLGQHVRGQWSDDGDFADQVDLLSDAEIAARAALRDRFAPSAGAAAGLASPVRRAFGTVSGTMTGPSDPSRWGLDFAGSRPGSQRRSANTLPPAPVTTTMSTALTVSRPGSSATAASSERLGSAASRDMPTMPGATSVLDDEAAAAAEAGLSLGRMDRVIQERTAHLPASQRATLDLATRAYCQEIVQTAMHWVETVAEVFGSGGGGGGSSSTGGKSAGNHHAGAAAAEDDPEADPGGTLRWREVLMALHLIVDPFALPHQHMRWAFALFGSSAVLDERPQPPIRLLSPARKPTRLRTGWSTRAQVEAIIQSAPQLKPEDTPLRRSYLAFLRGTLSAVDHAKNLAAARAVSTSGSRPGTAASRLASSRPGSPTQALAVVSPSPIKSPDVLAPVRQRASDDRVARQAMWSAPAGTSTAIVPASAARASTAMVSRASDRSDGTARRPAGGGGAVRPFRGRPLWSDGPGEAHWPGQTPREDDLVELPPEVDEDESPEGETRSRSRRPSVVEHSELGTAESKDRALFDHITGFPRWPRVKPPEYASIVCPARSIATVISALIADANKRVEMEDRVTEMQSAAYLPPLEPGQLTYVVEEAEKYDHAREKLATAESAALRTADAVQRRKAQERARDPWQWDSRWRVFRPRNPKPPQWGKATEAVEDAAAEQRAEAQAFLGTLGVGGARQIVGVIKTLEDSASPKRRKRPAASPIRSRPALTDSNADAVDPEAKGDSRPGDGDGADADDDGLMNSFADTGKKKETRDPSVAELVGTQRLAAKHDTKRELIETYRMLEQSLRKPGNWADDAARDIASLNRTIEEQSVRRRFPPVVLAVPSLLLPPVSEEDAQLAKRKEGADILAERRRQQWRRRAVYGRLVFHLLAEVFEDNLDEPSGVSLVQKGKNGMGLEPRSVATLRSFDQMLCCPPLFGLLRPRPSFEDRTDVPACGFEELYDPVIRAYIVKCRDTYRKAMAVRRVVRRITALELNRVMERWFMFVARRRHTRYRLTRFISAIGFAIRRDALHSWRRHVAVLNAAIRLQNLWRSRKAMLFVKFLRPRVYAAKTIQSTWRMYKYGLCARRDLDKRRHLAATHLQRIFRGRKGRARVRRLIQAQFRRGIADIRKQRRQLALEAEDNMAKKIQRAWRAHQERARLRAMRAQMWEARRAEERLAAWERQQALDAATRAAEERERLEAELQAAKEAEEAQERQEQTQRYMRVQRLRREKRIAQYHQNEETKELEQEVARRMQEAKDKFTAERERAQEKRRRQIIRLLRDLAADNADLREAVAYLDDTADAMPDEAVGQFGWRNFNARPAAAGGEAGADTFDVDLDGAHFMGAKFTKEEIEEQAVLGRRVTKLKGSELERLQEAARSGVANRRAKSLEIDAYVSALTQIINEELAVIADDTSKGEGAALKKVLEFRRAEEKRIDSRFTKRMRDICVEAAIMVQQAWRARSARRELTAALRNVYVKRWDEDLVCFVYENTRIGTTMVRKPMVFGIYDIRCEGVSPDAESQLLSRARLAHGPDGHPPTNAAGGLLASAATLTRFASGASGMSGGSATVPGAQGPALEFGTRKIVRVDPHAMYAAKAAAAAEQAAARDSIANEDALAEPVDADTAVGAEPQWEPGYGGEIQWSADGGYYYDDYGWWDTAGHYVLFPQSEGTYAPDDSSEPAAGARSGAGGE